MKIILPLVNFTFTPSLNQINFLGVGGFDSSRLYAVINVTTGKLVYAVASANAGFGGTFSGTVLTYASSNVGQTNTDVLQCIYDDPLAVQVVGGAVGVSGNVGVLDGNGNIIGSAPDPLTGDNRLFTQSSVQAGDGTPILSTYDPINGEDGLNVNLLNSSFGGQLGSALPIPNNNNALSMAFLNGSVLSAPRMDPVTNELIVQSSPVPMQNVNIAEVNGNVFAGINLPVTVDGFGGSGVSLGQNTRANSIPVVLASNQTPVPITATSPIEVTETVTNIDVLGADIIGQRNNQIELSWNTIPSANVTISTSGGASATASNGHTIFATGTTAGAAAVSAVSNLTTSYRAGHEVYAMFTAAFLNLLSNAVAIGQIGLLDSGANNGFTIGIFNGLFGIASYFNATPTLVYSNNFNTDLLNGGSTSKFTRDGTPEAIDLTKSNLFRIRFAWLGSGNIYFEVFSPDGEWVLFHNIRQPNSSYNPSLTTPDLPMRVQVTKGSGTTNASIASACWAAGTTSDVGPLSATITDATQAKMVRAVIEGKTTAGGGSYVPVKVNPSGALVTDATGSAVSVTGPLPVTVENYITGQLANNTTSASTVAGAGTNLLNAAGGTTSIDATGYRTVTVQIICNSSAAVINFEHSNDNINYQNFGSYRLDIATSSVNNVYGNITPGNATGFVYTFPVMARYVRLRLNTAPGVGQTLQCFTRFSPMAWTPPHLNVINNTAANLNANVSGSVTVIQPTPANLNVTALVAGATLASASVTDIANATQTTTQTSANISTLNTMAATFQVTTTATAFNAGTVLDVVVEETLDGTNYYTLYAFERISTTNAVVRSPVIKLSGTGIRYVRTISGGTPSSSIQNAVTRISRAGQAETIRRFIDRTIVPNTLNSTTGSFFCDGVEDFNLIVRCTAQTTPATIALEFSSDNTNWFTSSATVTTVAGVAQAKVTNEQWKFVRAIVTAAGTGITLGEVVIGGHSA